MSFRTTVRVRYAETDQMGVVYHGNYFTWFEVGRVEMLRSLGLSYAALEAEDCMLPVISASCQYRRPALYDDVLEIETTLKALREPLLAFAYALWRGDELLAEGETRHAVLNRAMRRRRLPPAYKEAMLRIMG